MLTDGEDLPATFSRPEVAKVLQAYYATLTEKVEIKTHKAVAVVGSGPAGLAAAQQLARAGHTVTLFEKSKTGFERLACGLMSV